MKLTHVSFLPAALLLATLVLPACADDPAAAGETGGASGDDGGSGGDGGDSGGDEGGDSGGTGDLLTDNLRSSAGAFATDYLQPDPYDSLLIEVDWVAGHDPDPDALDALVDALDEVLDKPGGITWALSDELPDQGGPRWTVQETEDIEVANRESYHDLDSGQAVISLTYLDGNSDEDPDSGGYILAYAYHGSSIIMFEERLAQSSSGLPLVGSVEATVLIHEVGHLLGLVDNGIDMVTDHRDDDHGDHDSNDDCIMYWAVNSDGVADLLLGSQPTFDEACRADMEAAGGKAR